jgi:hypothetical protein
LIGILVFAQKPARAPAADRGSALQ